MATKSERPTHIAYASSKSMRTSVSLPRELHETLTQLAKDKKVSIAWIIREAAEKYVGERWPLFADREKDK